MHRNSGNGKIRFDSPFRLRYALGFKMLLLFRRINDDANSKFLVFPIRICHAETAQVSFNFDRTFK